MKSVLVGIICGAILALTSISSAVDLASWSQWGGNAQHTGFMPVAAQLPEAVLGDVVVDPNAPANFDEEGDLLVHYQVPLVQGNSVYMAFKGPTWTGHDTWETQSWGMKRMDWKKQGLTTIWSLSSGWKPVPIGDWYWTGSYWLFQGPYWEPVFHGAVAGNWVYVPEAGGSLLRLNKATGAVAGWYKPFGSSINPNIYLNGPVTALENGNVYYNAIQLDPSNPWTVDVVGSWLVHITPGGRVSKVSYASLTPGAPAATDPCSIPFSFSDDANSLPWPPSPSAVPPTIPCGSQRAATNLAPAVAPDGTVYTASRAHLNDRYGYLIALNADLTLKWASSLRGRLNDGCGVSLPPNGTVGGCTLGATLGVDPATNEPPPGRLFDDSTGSPTVAPDGSVLFGVYTRYNFAQGHLLHFDSAGQFLGAFGFGWDLTPGIFPHDGTYSIVLKENRYGGVGSYCNLDAVCPTDRTATYPSDPENYFLTQLSPSLVPEWRWRNTNTLSCTRGPGVTVSCESDHPNGFEFCVNHVAIDKNGVVYANSEDGNLYAIGQGGLLVGNLFQNQALGAAYTPISIGIGGKLYSQNFGHMLVAGEQP